MVDEKALAEVIAAELDVAEMVLTDPLTLRRLKAERIARAVVASLSPGSTGETEGWVLVPKEPTYEQIEAMADAYRTTRRPGVCGMTIDAQFRAEFAPWFAAYRAMLSAAGER